MCGVSVIVSVRRSLGRYFGGSWQFRGGFRWDVTSPVRGNFAAAFVGPSIRRFMAISWRRSLQHHFGVSWQFRNGVRWNIEYRRVERYICVHGNFVIVVISFSEYMVCGYDTRLLGCGTERAVRFTSTKRCPGYLNDLQ